MKNSLRHLSTYILISILLILNSTICFAEELQDNTINKISDINKIWNIQFNSPLDTNTINNTNIKIVDSNNTIISPLKLAIKDSTVSIYPPKNGYPTNTNLFLNISSNITNKNRISLSKNIVFPFIVYSDKSSDMDKYVENLFSEEKNKSKNFLLGNERLIPEFSYLIDGRKVGLVTNQTGVNSNGTSTIDLLSNYKNANLTALYGPEHGIDGKIKAGDYVKSYTHETLNIPVYSLYGDTRKPTNTMLKNVDVLIFDIQDIGARSYTYMSTLNYCMKAAAENNKEIIVLDRPNPLGCEIFDGPVMEDEFETFVGVDNIPMTHGMTAGELAKFFNRNIKAKLTVIPMKGYTRDMIYQDTGLDWVQSSPYIPDITSVFCYNATGLGEGTGIFQSDSFKWVGSKNLDSDLFALFLNSSNLPGVKFIPEPRGSYGGVKLKITDFHKFNPAKTGIYVLGYGHELTNFKIPENPEYTTMFEKIMGTKLIGDSLKQNLSPQAIEAKYSKDLIDFGEYRKQFLIYK